MSNPTLGQLFITFKEEYKYHLVSFGITSLRVINHLRAEIIQDKQEFMSIGSQRLSERRKMKGLKVLELFDQGYSYRKIAKLVHLSLRDVAKFVNLVADNSRTPSMASIHDLIVLEYRVNLLRSEVKDLAIERDRLKNEVNDLRGQKYNLQVQVRARQSELDVVKRNLEYERFSQEIVNDIFTMGH